MNFKIIGYLDRHMAMPFLDFLIEKKARFELCSPVAQTRALQLYKASDLIASKLQLCQQTNMVDSIEEEFKRLHSADKFTKGRHRGDAFAPRLQNALQSRKQRWTRNEIWCTSS